MCLVSYKNVACAWLVAEIPVFLLVVSCLYIRVGHWDKAPKHFLVPTVINSPPSQEIMVSRICSVVLIFLDLLFKTLP